MIIPYRRKQDKGSLTEWVSTVCDFRLRER